MKTSKRKKQAVVKLKKPVKYGRRVRNVGGKVVAVKPRTGPKPKTYSQRVLVKCIGCGRRWNVYAGLTDHPCCISCGMPGIALSASV